MDYSEHIRTLQQAVQDLRRMKEILYTVEDNTLAIEKDVAGLDRLIPMREDLSKIRNKAEREQASHALDLLEEALSLIDEILGPPEDEVTGQPYGTAFAPEAKGNNKEGVSIDDLLIQLNLGSKRKTS